MGRPVVHWELLSKDPAEVADCYEKVFDWKIQHIPEINYRFVVTGGQGGINRGIIQPQRPEPWPGNMTVYIDVRGPRRLSAAHRRGGKQDYHRRAGCRGHGRVLTLHRSRGRMMGLWKQAKKQ
jgi:predicted enzyme related to lactoylglutathione lyase